MAKAEKHVALYLSEDEANILAAVLKGVDLTEGLGLYIEDIRCELSNAGAKGDGFRIDGEGDIDPLIIREEGDEDNG